MFLRAIWLRLQRKIDAALYRQYGGRIARLGGAPVPLDAYRRFLEAQAALGRFRIADPAQAAAFWGPFRADAAHEVYPAGSEAEAHAFDVPGAPASPAAKEPPGPRPFDKTLTLQGISFRVVSANQGSITRVTITPSGLGRDNQPVSREIDGTVTGAEVADLNGDGSPEIYVYVTSAGSGSYGSLVAYGANQRQSLSEVYLLPISEDVEASKGYMGHDSFAVSGNTLVRHFPLYKAGDRNAQPTGGSRQISYRLTSAEAGWVLRRERISDGR